MKIELKTTETKTFNVKYLEADCGVRYWEDAAVDGIEDTDGTLIPCRYDDSWLPLIELETGIITNWEQGKMASIHYKICDNGCYALLDEFYNVIIKIDGYVPNIMCPQGGGYGDYVIMNVDENGKIDKWSVRLDEFLERDED